jgi:hypothetical protein
MNKRMGLRENISRAASLQAFLGDKQIKAQLGARQIERGNLEPERGHPTRRRDGRSTKETISPQHYSKP